MNINEGINTFDQESVAMLQEAVPQVPPPQQIAQHLMVLNNDERRGLVKILVAAGFKDLNQLLVDDAVTDDEIHRIMTMVNLDELFTKILGIGNEQVLSILAYLMAKAELPQIAKIVTVAIKEMKKASGTAGKAQQNALLNVQKGDTSLNSLGGIQ